MRFCTTPLNLNKRLNEKSRKTHRSIGNKSIQKCTSLNRNGMQMRDRTNRMTRNPKKKQIIELSKLMGSDTRISIPTNRSTGNVRHNVIKRRDLSVWVHRLPYQGTPRAEATTKGVMTYSSPLI